MTLAYLQRPPKDSEPVGTLIPYRKNGVVQDWIIEGDPGMIELVKRLFPGSSSKGRGKCRFPNTKRNAENLNWVMLRYPLHIEDEQAWEDSYQAAVGHATRLREFSKRLGKEVPPPDFLGTLREFQKEGLSYLIGTERALLADEMGLGKTIQALAFLSATQAYPAIVVAPPHLIKNWEQEINRFLRLPGAGQLGFEEGNPANTIHVIKGLTPYDLPPANIYLTHYLLLRDRKSVV